MMYHYCWSLISATLVVGSVGASASLMLSTKASAQQAFPDVEPDYWASPFINVLAEQNIVTGYPDGTFRPEQPIDRDEYAAIIRKAFNQETVRTIPSGSVFKDVPAGYWAAPPIEEAYEMGFMKGYNENLFRPRQELTKAQALVALAKGLNLSYSPTVATTTQSSAIPVPRTSAKKRQVSKNRLVFPLAATVLMPPMLANPVQPTPPASTSAPTAAKGQNMPSGTTAKEFVSAHYTDAEQIPEDFINDVAAVTQASIVVNYPESEVLNPNELLNRGAAAALIHQTLVSQDKLPPLADAVEGSNYIVNPAYDNN